MRVCSECVSWAVRACFSSNAVKRATLTPPPPPFLSTTEKEWGKEVSLELGFDFRDVTVKLHNAMLKPDPEGAKGAMYWTVRVRRKLLSIIPLPPTSSRTISLPNAGLCRAPWWPSPTTTGGPPQTQTC